MISTSDSLTHQLDLFAFPLSGVEITSIENRRDLLRALQQSSYGELRGMIVEDRIVAWDAGKHTHDDFIRATGLFGIQILMAGSREGLTIYHRPEVAPKTLLELSSVERIVRGYKLNNQIVSVDIL